MAVALVGYFATMIAALTGLMFVLGSVFALSPSSHIRPQTHFHPVVTQTDATPASARIGQSIDPANDVRRADDTIASRKVATKEVAAGRASAERAKRLKLARLEKQRMLIRHHEQERETATRYAQDDSSSMPAAGLRLGYAQESPPNLFFGSMGASRF